MGMNMIKCADCSDEKPPESYPKRSGRETRRGICRNCLRARRRLKAAAVKAEAPPGSPAAAERDGGAQSIAQALYMDAALALGEQAASREREAGRGPQEGEAVDAAEAPRKRKGKRRRNRRKAAKPAAAAAHSAEDAVDASDGEQPATEAEQDEEERPRKKRKRRRKRGKAKKDTKALASGELAPPVEPEDGCRNSEGETGLAVAAEPDEEIALTHPEDEAGTDENESGAEAASPSKRKSKRKRKRGKKAKKLRTAAQERQAAEDNAARTEVFPEADGTNTDDDLRIEPISSIQRAGESEDGEETRPAKRKRPRKRRRQGKRAAESETEAPLEPKRPAFRPPNKRIVPFKGPFSYDSSILNDKGTGMIRLRGRRETGKRWHTEIEKDIAVRMVNEGAAGVIHPRLIHKLYTKSDFRLLILQRDNYVCRYCGQFGDTIDHVMPKSKGGLSTPMNCVCACSECNLLKADKLDFPLPDEWGE